MNNETIRPAAKSASIDLNVSRLTDGPAGGGRPGQMQSNYAIAALLCGIQAIGLGLLLPLPGGYRLGLMLGGALILVFGLILVTRRGARKLSYASERLIINRWLAANAPFDRLGCEELAWSRAFEIGEGQYEFRSMVNKQARSLIVDLGARVASIAVN
ncbi:hypothetical protein GCM10025867_50820 (plasmid) [Frondihabitans sucicola]|uniref:PH domain-containing protein n=1 Tax=Frondihabitans sucicola TaxID=1268041 RepID=A0ABN6Y6M9_9MICO|nr:hypothetical protein [Frondihabitans sucicola]BDZ52841.1 hypothetical protein GCM10025867_50820 [Frondihabitans sucicola]